jgi:membrane-anchored protein YejM (alkaline phosphatase superfamily)
VYDALAALNMSLHGYGRETTPNLQRLSQRAIVYHNHYAAANFTTPGTASLLTGMLPWTHRALQIAAPIYKPLRAQSLFQAFEGYHRLAYSHNPLADRLFSDLKAGLENRIPLEELLLSSDGMIQSLFRRDEDIASLSWSRAVKQSQNGGVSSSLFLKSPSSMA